MSQPFTDTRENFTETDSSQEERILTFMESMDAGNTLFLRQLEQEALEEGIPIIRTQTQSLLKFFLMLKRPARILEVGTATGFSALLMLRYAPGSPALLTIEKDEERYQKALANKAAAWKAGELDRMERCDMRLGDAAVLLPALADAGETFDLIFMDAAKGQYIHFLPAVLQLLTPGGILISDNILKEGEILQSRYAVKRRDRTIHRRMREYLWALTHTDALRTLLLQEGDGAAVSVRTDAPLRNGESDQ